jgi:hypothetical protein
MKAPLPIVAACTVILIGIFGCGGGGGGSSSGNTTPLSCGPEYLTPNYTQATDPGDNEPNLILTWPGFPLNVYYQTEETRTFGGNTFSTTDIFQDALARWVSASGGEMAINTISTTTGADIIVNVNQLGAAPGSGGTLGFTQVTYFPSTGQIVSARITINTWPGMTQAQFTNGLRGTTTHEFGHALFLQGHSDNTADNMYYQGSSSTDKVLSTRDANSFLTAYCGTFASRSRSREAVGAPGEQPVTITINCGH